MAALSKAEVKDRLFTAYKTLRLLPRERVQGFVSCWPEIAPDRNLAYGYNEAEVRETLPRSERGRLLVDQMLEMFRYVNGALEPGYERKLVWMRASDRLPWKEIAYRCEWSEKKVRNDFDTFLGLIALHIAGAEKEKRVYRPVRLASGSLSSAMPKPIFRPTMSLPAGEIRPCTNKSEPRG